MSWCSRTFFVCERTGVSSIMALASNHLSSSRVRDIEELEAGGVWGKVRWDEEILWGDVGLTANIVGEEREGAQKI